MMLTHHLFGLPTLIRPPAEYLPLIPGVPVEFWLGRLGKACVGVFLFLSGYGLACGVPPTWRRAGSKALRFWGMYLPYALGVWVIGQIWFGEMRAGQNLRFSDDWLTGLANLLTIRFDFAYEWWFAQTYILLILLSPLILPLTARPRLLAVLSVAGFLLGAALDVKGVRFGPVSLSNLLIWQLPFVQGALIARLPGRALPQLAAPAALAVLLVLFGLVESVAPAALTPVLIVTAPLWVLVLRAGIARLPDVGTRALVFLGSYSLALWLVHPFLCYYFAQGLIYAPRLSVLVLALLLITSLMVVIPVEAARRTVLARFGRAP